MNFTFSHRKLSGLLAIVPAHERSFVDEMTNFNFPLARTLKLKDVMGYDKRRIVNGPVCVSDLACFGMDYLFNNGLLGRDDFDALFVITQSPDYFMPPTSNVIQGRLGLKQDLFCMDINQGCAGFLIGVIQGFLLLDQPSVNKVVLINADVLSRKVSVKDRNSYPLVGDAASIAILERSDDPAPIHANLKMDGTRCDALIIPAGGFRLPSSPATAILEDDGKNNLRAKDNLRMNGTDIFNFVQVEVPPMIDALMKAADSSHDDVEYFLFHQPNRFMLEKLADKMKVPRAKVLSNVVQQFGNSSGVTIPMVIVSNLTKRIVRDSINICFAGFGVGLTWASMLMHLGPMNFCELIDYH